MDDNQIKVLLVDDNPIDARVIQKMLSVALGGPFPTVWADRLSTGLEQLARGEFDVLLLDLWLPDSEGLDTFVKARAEAPEMPIVVLSGLDDESIAVKAVQAGAQDYLVKAWINKHLLARALRFAVERKHTEEILMQERALLRTLIDNLPDSVFVKDTAGRIILDNTAHRRLAGARSTDDLVGKTDFELFSRELAAQYDADDQQVIKSGEPVVNREEPSVDPDGNRRWLLTSRVPLKDGHHRVTGIVGINHDITDRKRAEEEIKSALRMKSDFVAFATHQLRTPLAGIKWLLELAAQGTGVSEENVSLIQDARESAERLIGLVNDLLDVSRLESGKLTLAPQETNLAELTESVLKDVRLQIQKKEQQLSVDEGQAIPPVRVDPQLFRQVILNLISNAIKYTPRQGRIAIEIGAENGSLRWAVRDSGIGIPKTAQARLFEKFFRADNVYKVETEGTGLGLYLVRLIVERSGGKVWCESEEGQGSTFRFSLPLTAGT